MEEYIWKRIELCPFIPKWIKRDLKRIKRVALENFETYSREAATKAILIRQDQVSYLSIPIQLLFVEYSKYAKKHRYSSYDRDFELSKPHLGKRQIPLDVIYIEIAKALEKEYLLEQELLYGQKKPSFTKRFLTFLKLI